MSHTIQDYVDCRGLAIQPDREHGIIRGVRVLGLSSAAGRSYQAEAVRKAAPLFEGVAVHVNRETGAPEGPAAGPDRLGVIRNVTARPDRGLIGDLHFDPRHPLAEQLLWDAEHAPHNVGFAHRIEAQVAESGGAGLVEAIDRVHSVDLVADGARIVELNESEKPQIGRRAAGGAALDWLTAELLADERPDLVAELLSEQDRQIARLEEELRELRTSAEAAAKREAVGAILAEYGLSAGSPAEGYPPSLVNEPFLESLARADGEAAIRRLIEERLDLVRQLSAIALRQPKSSEPSPLPAGQPEDTKAFVRSISEEPQRGPILHRNLC
ncbi:MAG: hypothetical protein GXX96_11250 [Planctomycetaceae bacterium]|nr:hypothetical protein [Planctomycetaceae bacterium]